MRSTLSLLFYFGQKILLASNVDPDQAPYHVVSDLGLHCLPAYEPFTGLQVRMGYYFTPLTNPNACSFEKHSFVSRTDLLWKQNHDPEESQ